MPARQSILGPLALALSSLTIACSGGSTPTAIPSAGQTESAPAATLTDMASPTRPATATPGTAPTESPTQAPTEAASPGPSLDKADAVVLAYEQSGGVEYEIVQQVNNDGSGWVKPAMGASTFTIFDQTGTALDFVVLGPRVGIEIALPSHIPAGGTSYLLCNYFSDDFPLSAYDHAESDVLLQAVDGPPGATLTIANAETRTGTWGGLDVVADITNPGNEPVAHADVGALFFDADGIVIGFTSGLVQDIGPGATKHVEIPGTYYFDGDRLAEVTFFAQPWDS